MILSVCFFFTSLYLPSMVDRVVTIAFRCSPSVGEIKTCRRVVFPPHCSQGRWPGDNVGLMDHIADLSIIMTRRVPVQRAAAVERDETPYP